ncbi:hypothetical protein Tco_1121278 [Tanacetum coccineum]|uniref:Reverse transcriptase domain-containing protein n=1 Tax=Tanacetum coccineum TaxID=301880 RepID=A0ABQ5J064_9ASTR
MSTSTHLIIILSDSDIKDAFSSTDYTLASPDYSPASLGNTSSDSKTESDPSKDLFEDRLAPLAITPFPDDPYHPNGMTFIHIARKRVLAPQAHIASPPVLHSPPVVTSSPLSHPRDSVIEIGENSQTVVARQPTIITLMMHLERHEEQIDTILNHLDEFPLKRIKQIEYGIEGLVDGRVTMALLPPGFLEPLYPDIMAMINAQDIKHIIPPTPPSDTDPLVGSPIPSSPSSSIGSSSPVRSTTPPPDYPFDKSIFAELDNSLWIITRPLGSKPVPEEPNEMAPKRKSTSAAPAITQATIRKLVDDSIAAALEAQVATMEMQTIPIGTPEKWNSFAQPIGIEEAYKTTWFELKKLLTKKYCPRTEELAVLCPTMVPNSEKLMEVFIGGLPRNIEGNVTASKPQTLEEAITIA